MGNQVILVETRDGDPLPHGRIGEAATRIESKDMRSLRIGTGCEVMHVERDLLSCHLFWCCMAPRAEGQVIIKAASICIDGCRSQLEIMLHLQPGVCPLALCNQRVKLPTDLLHMVALRE